MYGHCGDSPTALSAVTMEVRKEISSRISSSAIVEIPLVVLACTQPGGASLLNPVSKYNMCKLCLLRCSEKPAAQVPWSQTDTRILTSHNAGVHGEDIRKKQGQHARTGRDGGRIDGLTGRLWPVPREAWVQILASGSTGVEPSLQALDVEHVLQQVRLRTVARINAICKRMPSQPVLSVKMLLLFQAFMACISPSRRLSVIVSSMAALFWQYSELGHRAY